MNSEFIQKMIQAKKLEKEAVLTLLPKSLSGHLDVIENEMKMMIMDLAKECVAESVRAAANPGEDKKVKKVSIS
jgi:hypothetical protein